MTSPIENPQQTSEQAPPAQSADSPGAASMARLFIVAFVVVALTMIASVAGQIYYG